MYFKTKIEYLLQVEDEEGFEKKKEDYLVNADSVTYAEAKILKDLPSNYRDKTVMSVNKSNVSEIIQSSGNEWFIVGMKFATDEVDKKGKVKYQYSPIMINGKNIDNAIENINDHFGTADFKIVSVQSTKIVIFDSLLSSDVRA